jgi:hypothetical protein
MMLQASVQSLVFALVLAAPLCAQGPGHWDGAVAGTSQFVELEAGFMPRSLDQGRGDLLFGPMRLGLGLVLPKGDHPSGLRLHLDTLGGGLGPYLQAGLIASAGQDLGAGLGARFGVGYRFREGIRVAILADGVLGSKKSQGSVGIQAAYTF